MKCTYTITEWLVEMSSNPPMSNINMFLFKINHFEVLLFIQDGHFCVVIKMGSILWSWFHLKLSFELSYGVSSQD